MNHWYKFTEEKPNHMQFCYVICQEYPYCIRGAHQFDAINNRFTSNIKGTYNNLWWIDSSHLMPPISELLPIDFISDWESANQD